MRGALFISLMLLSFSAFSQVTVINDYAGKQVVENPEDYRLTGATEHTVIVNHYEKISKAERRDLTGLIIDAIDFYLDEVMIMQEDKMMVRKDEKEIMKDLQRIVSENIALYEYKVDEEFAGFSQEFEDKIKRIEQLNWTARTEDIENNTVFNKRQMALNYVRKQIKELKEITARDLEVYAELHIHEYKSSSHPDEPQLAYNPPDEQVKNGLMPPYIHTLERIDMDDPPMYIEPELHPSSIPTGANKEIVALLKSNNELMKVFAEQMVSLQQQVLEVQKESVSTKREFADIRTELKSLQLAIQEIDKNNQVAVNRSTAGPVTEKGTITIQFEKNQSELKLLDKTQLNQVTYTLLTDQSASVMITGFADRSGTPELNAAISRARANAVKRYLAKQGVQSDKLMLNYLGDSLSNSENASDRKVEVTLLR